MLGKVYYIFIVSACFGASSCLCLRFVVLISCVVLCSCAEE